MDLDLLKSFKVNLNSPRSRIGFPIDSCGCSGGSIPSHAADLHGSVMFFFAMQNILNFEFFMPVYMHHIFFSICT